MNERILSEEEWIVVVVVGRERIAGLFLGGCCVLGFFV